MDPRPSPGDETCSIARALSVLGHKWNLLLLREAFLGRTRYSEFQQIGVPSGTLGNRLDALVSAGLLEVRQYQMAGSRRRSEYVLTSSGREVLPVLIALGEWADANMPLPDGPSIVVRTASDHSPAHLAFIDSKGACVSQDALRLERGPGYKPALT